MLQREVTGVWRVSSMKTSFLFLRIEMLLHLSNCTFKTEIIVFITTFLWARGMWENIVLSQFPPSASGSAEGEKTSLGNFLYILHSASASFKRMVA